MGKGVISTKNIGTTGYSHEKKTNFKSFSQYSKINLRRMIDRNRNAINGF